MTETVVYSVLSQASWKAFLFPANARQSVYASGACDKELETNRLAGFCVDAMIKQCSKCKKWKLFTEFSIDNSRGKSRRIARCKACVRENGRQWYADNQEREREKRRNYSAQNTDTTHERYLKHRNQNPDQYRKEQRENMRKWRAENPEKAREQDRQWNLNNPQKAKEKYERYRLSHLEQDRVKSANRRAKVKGNGGTITVTEWEALKKFYNYTCLCCGRREPEIQLTHDHVKPIAMGGENTIRNSQPLCKSCNSRKGKKHIDYRKVIYEG